MPPVCCGFSGVAVARRPRYKRASLLCAQTKGNSMKPITSFLSFALLFAGVAAGQFVNFYLGAALVLAAIITAMSLKMANTWEKFVILRMGKLQSVQGAGLFLIIPIIDNVIAIIDERIQTTA